MRHFAVADYRAFQLAIVNVDTGLERPVISTLDQYQYPTYFNVRTNERVEYRQSWMCWGNSSNFRPICPNPKASDE